MRFLSASSLANVEPPDPDTLEAVIDFLSKVYAAQNMDGPEVVVSVRLHRLEGTPRKGNLEKPGNSPPGSPT